MEASLRRRLAAGEFLCSAWSALPEPLVAEILGRCGFDAVTLDMQHGYHDERSVLLAITGLAGVDTASIVRIPVGRNDMASRALDMGAAGIIAPMIDSVGDARALVDACRFPPVGRRSWGPHRAMQLQNHGDKGAYLAAAASETVVFAMIETRESLAAAADIASVDGIDGLFVGPSDFSLTWTGGETVDPAHEGMMDAIRSVAQTARSAGKFAAIFCADPSHALRYRDMGFGLTAFAIDHTCLAAGATMALGRARGET